MGKPESWIDILAKSKKQNLYTGHSWVILGSSGGSPARSISGIERGAQPATIKYKCSKCGITATKEVCCEFVINPKYQGLTCAECIIKDIIE